MARENNSSVVRVHKNADFTIMSNHHLRNMKLSLKAVGLMSKLLGLPDDWCYSVAGLVKICKEGETAVRAALHELIDEKYVYVEKLSPNCSKSGRFEYVYHIYEIPYENMPYDLEHPELFIKEQEKRAKITQQQEIVNAEKQGTENLHLEIQGVENRRQLNTKQSSTKKSNTKELNTPPAADVVADKSVPEKTKSKKPKEKKQSYAEAVMMTETEYQKLLEQHTKPFADRCIEVLNNYKLSSGKRYKSDYHAILSWVIERVSKDCPQLESKPKMPDIQVNDENYNPFDQFL